MLARMVERAVGLPDAVRSKAAELGAPGVRWLAELPAVIAELERRWALTVGPPFPGGSTAYVAPARTPTGADAVVKIGFPTPESEAEIRTLADADGRGYAQLLAADTARHAMLLEALGPSLRRLDLPPERQLELLCDTLLAAWRQPSLQASVRPEKAERLARTVRDLWHELDRPCSAAVVDRALDFADRRARAFDPDRCVVLHGDPHPGNTLRTRTARPGNPSGFVFVDPESFVDDPAYDLGVALRDWSPQLLAAPDPVALARHYCRLLADRSGSTEGAIWEWGYLERVSTGLYITSLGADELGRPFLDTAELLLAG
jgi:streptomycin 6-kinase